MSYRITDGVPEIELAEWIDAAGNKFGRFEDGRVNYSAADKAPIVMCTVVCGDEILLVKRGYGLADAEGYWSTVNGFIDEIKPVSEQAIQEVREELGLIITHNQVTVRDSYTLSNPEEKRSYIVFPCLVQLNKKLEIVLNEENIEFVWTTHDKLSDFEMLDDLPYSIEAALSR